MVVAEPSFFKHLLAASRSNTVSQWEGDDLCMTIAIYDNLGSWLLLFLRQIPGKKRLYEEGFTFFYSFSGTTSHSDSGVLTLSLC